MACFQSIVIGFVTIETILVSHNVCCDGLDCFPLQQVGDGGDGMVGILVTAKHNSCSVVVQ